MNLRIDSKEDPVLDFKDGKQVIVYKKFYTVMAEGLDRWSQVMWYPIIGPLDEDALKEVGREIEQYFAPMADD